MRLLHRIPFVAAAYSLATLVRIAARVERSQR
jgi:hypothetical protein